MKTITRNFILIGLLIELLILPAQAFRPVDSAQEHKRERPPLEGRAAFNQIIQAELYGAPKSEEAIESALIDYLMNHNILPEELTGEHLKLSYFRWVQVKPYHPATIFVQLVQTNNDVEVKGTYVHAVLKDMNNRTTLVSVKSQLYPKIVETFPFNIAPSSVSFDPLSIAVDRLGACPNPEISETIRYMANKWRETYEVACEGSSFKVLIDKANGLSKLVDLRHRLGNGTVKGWGLESVLDEVSELELRHLDIPAQGQVRTRTDEMGQFELPNNLLPEDLDVKLRGPFANVNSESSDNLTIQQRLNPDQTLDLSFNLQDADEKSLAQVTGYYHTTLLHDWIVDRVPGIAGSIDNYVRVNVNLPIEFITNDACNAFYDGGDDSINFYVAADDPILGACPNQAYDVVIAHELGHLYDDVFEGIPDDGLSEGWGDTIAAFYTGRPEIYREDFVPGHPILFRSANNNYNYPRTQADANEGEPHILGLAWSGFSWDLRTQLMARDGSDEGIRKVEEDLVIPVLEANSPSIPDAVMDVIHLDDTDDNLLNGTPNFDEIIFAAQKHRIPLRAFVHFTEPTGDISVDPDAPPVSIKATATHLNIKTVELLYTEGGLDTVGQWKSKWPTITQPIVNEEVGVWDPSAFEEGFYTLRLKVTTEEDYVFEDFMTITVGIIPHRITNDENLTSTYFDIRSHDVNGDWVVWRKSTWSNESDIMVHNLETGETKQVTETTFQTSAARRRIQVEYPWVVWIQSRTEVHAYNIETDTLRSVPFVTGTDFMDDLAINDGRIVWASTRGEEGVYLLDLASGDRQTIYQVTGENQEILFVDIWGDKVVWLELDEVLIDDEMEFVRNTYLYDLANPEGRKLISNETDSKSGPKISGDYVVWISDARNWGRMWDIYLYHIPTDTLQNLTRLNPPGTFFSEPYIDIDGSTIVWADPVDGNWDVKAFKFLSGGSIDDSTIRLTSHPGIQNLPRISGNRVVAVDYRDGVDEDKPSLYLYELPESAPLFVRGETDDNGKIEIADVLNSLFYQLLGTDRYNPTCLDALDVDDNGTIDINDPVFALAFLFLPDVDSIPLPGREGTTGPLVPGVDPTPDHPDVGGDLGCTGVPLVP